MYAEASQVANDAVGSIRTVASFCAEEKVMETYRGKCEGPLKAGIKQGLISGMGFGVSNTLMFCVYATSFYAGALLVQNGKITFADVYRVCTIPPVTFFFSRILVNVCYEANAEYLQPGRFSLLCQQQL